MAKKRPVGRPRKLTPEQKEEQRRLELEERARKLKGRQEDRWGEGNPPPIDHLKSSKDGGRPAKWDNPEKLRERVESYFEEFPQKNWTLTGLAMWCGFSSRLNFKNYATREGFEDIINFALMKVEHSYEMDLKHFGRSGTIFALKNMEWTDKQQIESVSLNLSLGGGMTSEQMVKLAERYTKMYDLLKTPDGYTSMEEEEEKELASEI